MRIAAEPLRAGTLMGMRSSRVSQNTEISRTEGPRVSRPPETSLRIRLRRRGVSAVMGRPIVGPWPVITDGIGTAPATRPPPAGPKAGERRRGQRDTAGGGALYTDSQYVYCSVTRFSFPDSPPSTRYFTFACDFPNLNVKARKDWFHRTVPRGRITSLRSPAPTRIDRKGVPPYVNLQNPDPPDLGGGPGRSHRSRLGREIGRAHV